MVKMLIFLTKRQDLETQAFIKHYEESHAPLVCGLAPPPLSYKRNFLMRGDGFNMEDSAIDFDVVTELVFPDRETLGAWATRLAEADAREKIVTDESRFLDRSKIRAYIVEEHVSPR